MCSQTLWGARLRLARKTVTCTFRSMDTVPFILDLPQMQTTQEIKQIKAYFSVEVNNPFQLIAWSHDRQKTWTRLVVNPTSTAVNTSQAE